MEIIDLCTGSGCIALLLAHLLGPALRRVRGYDLSPQAIRLAHENAHRCGLVSRVEMAVGDVFDEAIVGEMGNQVDMVVSNPPYIPRRAWAGLPTSVKGYEDPRALIGDPEDVPSSAEEKGAGGGGRGLAFYRRIAEILPLVLSPEEELRARGWEGMPRVAVEVGKCQAAEVADILRSGAGGMVRETGVWEDQYGQQRMVVGWG